MNNLVQETERLLPPYCKDCGNPLTVDLQEMRRGAPLVILTCKNPNCSLWSVTLSEDVYNSLTEAQLDSYRTMVAGLKERFKGMRS